MLEWHRSGDAIFGQHRNARRKDSTGTREKPDVARETRSRQFAQCLSRLLLSCSHFARIAQFGSRLVEVAHMLLDLLNVALVCSQVAHISLDLSLTCRSNVALTMAKV